LSLPAAAQHPGDYRSKRDFAPERND